MFSLLNSLRAYWARRFARKRLERAETDFDLAASTLVQASHAARASGWKDKVEMEAATASLRPPEERLREARAEFVRVTGGPKPVALTERVARKVRRLFPPEQQAEAISLLEKECGHNLPPMERAEPQALDQIRLAVLKLADGSLVSLREQIEVAKVDRRDVIGPAEMPEALKVGLLNVLKLDALEHAELNARDRQQYEAWLKDDDATS